MGGAPGVTHAGAVMESRRVAARSTGPWRSASRNDDPDVPLRRHVQTNAGAPRVNTQVRELHELSETPD
jgi:hypothetical protein